MLTPLGYSGHLEVTEQQLREHKINMPGLAEIWAARMAELEEACYAAIGLQHPEMEQQVGFATMEEELTFLVERALYEQGGSKWRGLRARVGVNRPTHGKYDEVDVCAYVPFPNGTSSTAQIRVQRYWLVDHLDYAAHELARMIAGDHRSKQHLNNPQYVWRDVPSPRKPPTIRETFVLLGNIGTVMADAVARVEANIDSVRGIETVMMNAVPAITRNLMDLVHRKKVREELRRRERERREEMYGPVVYSEKEFDDAE